MSSPVARNRLADEESPYLQDHADNPVNWQPWDEKALETAREHDLPIFLSVGYAACHWCHVMADESFDDERVASVLNQHFVPIKVDREERPDVDSIYQTICQQVSGRGGWPLSVWLTPEGKPFQVGTYFPKEPKRGMPGFEELLQNIASAWNDPDEREKIEERASQWTGAVTRELEEVPDESNKPEEDVLESAAKAAVRGADRQHGGWGTGPKFPQTSRLEILLRAYERTERDVYLDIVTETLDAMANGGMYDHIGGGFHRYATDRDWTVPHFEKMLYDNAELPRAYLAAYQVTDDERYATVTRETLEFVERELAHEDGGFFSTLDAQSKDSEGNRKEGAFFVWTPEEIYDAVADEKAARVFCDRFGVTKRGNFEGKTVLTIEKTIAELAETHEQSPEEIESMLESAVEQVASLRETRPRPPRDEKVLASWNGLMISAFAQAAIVLDESFAEPAVSALTFVRENLWDGEKLKRRYKDGVAKFEGYLEDYAFLARGAFDLFQATRDIEQLAFAMELTTAIEQQFWDESERTLYFTPEGGEQLITRPQQLMDQSTPSSAGVAAELFDMLSHFRSDDQFAEIAEQVVETHGNRITASPLQHASLVMAADAVTNGVLELTLVAEEVPDDWRTELADRYHGARVLAWRPPGEEEIEKQVEQLGLKEVPPIWEGRDQLNEKPTVYACRSFTCSPGRTDITRSLNWAERML